MEPFLGERPGKARQDLEGEREMGLLRLGELQGEKHPKRTFSIFAVRVGGQISHFVTSCREFRKHVLFKTLGIGTHVRIPIPRVPP